MLDCRAGVLCRRGRGLVALGRAAQPYSAATPADARRPDCRNRGPGMPRHPGWSGSAKIFARIWRMDQEPKAFHALSAPHRADYFANMGAGSARPFSARHAKSDAGRRIVSDGSLKPMPVCCCATRSPDTFLHREFGRVDWYVLGGLSAMAGFFCLVVALGPTFPSAGICR